MKPDIKKEQKMNLDIRFNRLTKKYAVIACETCPKCDEYCETIIGEVDNGNPTDEQIQKGCQNFDRIMLTGFQCRHGEKVQ